MPPRQDKKIATGCMPADKLNAMPDLKELQAQIVQLREERGFTTDPIRIFTLLNEEIGEIAAELKKTWSVNYDRFQKEALQEEIADAMVLLVALAHCYDIDVETAIVSKFFEKDGKRTWKSTPIPS